jgi:hypothetical protein
MSWNGISSEEDREFVLECLQEKIDNLFYLIVGGDIYGEKYRVETDLVDIGEAVLVSTGLYNFRKDDTERCHVCLGFALKLISCTVSFLHQKYQNFQNEEGAFVGIIPQKFAMNICARCYKRIVEFIQLKNAPDIKEPDDDLVGNQLGSTSVTSHQEDGVV